MAEHYAMSGPQDRRADVNREARLGGSEEAGELMLNGMNSAVWSTTWLIA